MEALRQLESDEEFESRFMELMEAWCQYDDEVVGMGSLLAKVDSKGMESLRRLKEDREALGRLEDGKLVGMESRVAKVEKLLNLGSDEVQVVCIRGERGLGKTTIARVLCRSISRHFDASCFIDRIERQISHPGLSLMEIIDQKLEIKGLETRTPNQRKFLIVLDGVGVSREILDALNSLRTSERLARGSRIIITTRSEVGVTVKRQVNYVYEPELLSNYEAQKLFCMIAFECNYPKDGFQEMTESILAYANGHPLKIINLGKMLFQKSVGKWRTTLNRLKRGPDPLWTKILFKMNYKALDDECKEIFLYIACFFIGKKMDRVKEILNSCGFPDAKNGMKLLIKKSLLKKSLDHIIVMDERVRDMGRQISRQESPSNPTEQRRLWRLDDIEVVMEQNGSRAMERVEAISLELEDSKRVTLRIEGLSRMNNLRLLIFHNVNFSGTLNSLSNELRYVSWHQYPFTSLPLIFEPQALVELILLDSNIKELWEGKKVLPKLKILKLSGSKNLIKVPNLGGIPNLERLELEECIELLQLHPSIAEIPKLKFLNLRNCINLVSIPNILFGQRCLKVLNLAGCSKFASRLRFYPLKSTAEVKLLSIWYHPFLERMLYFFLFVLPLNKNYHRLVCCFLLHLLCRAK
ncbi:hypothetical protein QN277_006098 [Acacia crassicarpa]|uniref:Uncharacterized protein n=1 Tax=Acacia crassicarpa TaxID=499986 RepID=A0AAE1JUW6_9FABA|nr:hypothetical protein QN277_006098 [Acacia crassicarpa]